MNTSTTLKAAAVLALGLFASSALGQRMEKYTPIAIGSEYVLVQENSGSFGAGTRDVGVRVVGTEWKGRTVQGFQGPEGTILVEPDGAWFAIVGKDGRETVTWDPPVGYSYPLEPGKSWVRSTTMTLHAQGRTVPVESRLSVEAFEDVTVPAGTYKAYRVRSVNNVGEESVNWFQPELGIFVKSRVERSAQHAAGAGVREMQLKTLNLQR